MRIETEYYYELRDLEDLDDYMLTNLARFLWNRYDRLLFDHGSEEDQLDVVRKDLVRVGTERRRRRS